MSIAESPLRRPADAKPTVNVGETERTLSAAVGFLLVTVGLPYIRWSRVALVALGGALVYRGLSGHCSLYQAIDIDTSENQRLTGSGKCAPPQASCSLVVPSSGV